MRNRKVFVSCHNCSRRRLRCDRSKPSCHKCTSSGLECPGYGRILTWVQGHSVKAQKKPAPQRPEEVGAVSQQPRLTATWPWSGANDDHSAPRPLQDPRFGHVDEATRLYIDHFESRVCKDLVAHDHPGTNPFRQLVPLALDHPFLLHILVATSALHLFNTLHCTRLTTVHSHLVASGPPTAAAPPGPDDQLSRSALTDALAAKHRAICSLRSALVGSGPGDREIVLAAILFFINFELIDVGNDGWQPHLRGAGRVMALLAAEASNTPRANRLLFDVVISDCLIYHVLGSTLSPAWLTASITHRVLDLFSILERTEPYSYLSCPTALLRIILATSQLSVSVLDTTDPALRATAAVSALDLLNQALSLDTQAWAAKVNQQWRNDDGNMKHSVGDPKSRISQGLAPQQEHVASAHRSAACLYILQAVPETRATGTVSSDELVADIIGHLEQVGEGDTHFKGTSWPTFVAGAEARDPETRAWLLGRLLSGWNVCPWGYIFTAIEMLKKLWAMQDARTAGDSDFGRVSGLRELWAMNLDCLVI